MKTLVLAVDRDNDYGEKANVPTPVIGLDDCLNAAMMLGIADPEDSDVNGLLAAIQTYKEIMEDSRGVKGREAEIALICGDRKVGHRSDYAVIDQLDEVLAKVRPDRVILVGDGAEDEYIYPVITSRVQVDSVRKVYVKQAPGVEGTLYIISRMMKDADKRKRFLVPLGGLFLLIGLIFIFEGLYAYMITGDGSYIYTQTWPILSLILGIMLLMYGYNIMDRFIQGFEDLGKNIKSGDITITFSIIAFGLLATGIAMGAYSIWNIQTGDTLYLIVQFCSYAMWPIILSMVFSDGGKVMKTYLSMRKINRSFMVGTIAVIGIGFILQGVLDLIKVLMGYGEIGSPLITLEIIIGVGFLVASSVLQTTFSRYFRSLHGETDEVQ